MNHKKGYRIHREENPDVRTKTRKKLASRARVPLERVCRPNEQWSMDFVTDRTEEDRFFRVLTVVDNFSRECLGLLADRSMSDAKVSACLNRTAENRGNLGIARVE